ncbi:MAG: hypothetical protein U0Q16_17415 [Bryobacteraceae bacterium]
MRKLYLLSAIISGAVAALGAEISEAKPEVVHRLPALSSVFPQGSRPGTKLSVEVLGQNLDRVLTAAFIDDSIRARITAASPTKIDLEFDVPAAAMFGPHYFRVVSPRGASNVLLFRVGDQPHHDEREPNSDLEHAEAVNAPVTINGRLNVDDDYDFFRFHADAGETWIFDLRSARNGSGLDAALILLDSRGRKLEHDEDTFIWDPFFAHRFKDAGDYMAVVQPTHTRNDPGFAYQLDIRRAAHVETLSPISLVPGAETRVTLYGHGLADAKADLRFDAAEFGGSIEEARGTSAVARIRVPSDAKPGPHELRVVSRGLSSPVTFLVDATPAHAGGELRPPVSITGTARYRQPESFTFRAEAGQKLVFEVRAQRFGSRADTMLRILDAKGKLIASNDDATFAGVNFNKDPRVLHTFKDAGEYRLEIRSMWQTTGEDFPYQLLVKPPEPRAELMLGSDQPYAYPGEKAKLKVSAVRIDGHDQPVKVRIEGLPEGVTASEAVIEKGKNDAEIEIDPGTAKPGTYAAVRVVTGNAAPAWRSVRISSGGGEGAAFARVDRAWFAVVEKPLFSLECASTSVNLVRGGGADLKVMIRRRPDFEEKLAFHAENLPVGVSVETVLSGKDEATLRFRATPDAALGRAARVVILGDGRGQTHQAPKIALVLD